MSIINNVLKDLESRPSRFTSIDVVSATDHDDGDGNSRRAWFIVLPAIVVCAIGFLYYHGLYQPEDTVVVPSQKVDPLPVEIVSTTSPLVEKVELNRVTGMQIRESSSRVSLEFSLREKAVSYLKERTENYFIYHLKNVGSEIEAPRIVDNRWIEKLDISQSQEGLDVALQTSPGVLVNTEQTDQQGETVWTISLEKLPDSVAVAKVETEVVRNEAKIVEDENKSIENIEAAFTTVETQAVSEPTRVEISTAAQPVSASSQLDKAVRHIRSGQWQVAETLLQGLLSGTQDLPAREQLLGVYSRNGNAEGYLLLARQSHDRYPDNGLFKTEYARALFQDKKYSETIDLLQTSSTLDPVQQALMAASYQRKDDHKKAIEHYHHALRLDESEARNWIGLAVSLEHEARLEKALQAYQTALRLGTLNERLQKFVENRSRMLKQVMN